MRDKIGIGRTILLLSIPLVALLAGIWYSRISSITENTGVQETDPAELQDPSRAEANAPKVVVQPVQEASSADAQHEDVPQLFSLIRNEFDLDAAYLDLISSIISSAESFPERHRAVRALSDRLSPDEVQALYRFLLALPPEGRRERIHDRAIKNDILNCLRNQESAPEGLTALMAKVFDDHRQDRAVRGYALQHLRAWHPKAPAGETDLIFETLRRGLEEERGSTAGTALLSLRHLEETGPSESAASVVEAALEMVQNENLDHLSRITAMQVAAEAGATETLETARQWALDTSSSYPRRASAVAALGAIGSEEAADVLAEIAETNDEYLKPAIHAAYRRLREANPDKEPYPIR